MRVKYVRRRVVNGIEAMLDDLTMGDEYIVMQVSSGFEVTFYIHPNLERLPCYFENSIMDVTSTHIPSTWGIAFGRSGYVTLSPLSWLKVRDFMDRFVDPDEIEPEIQAMFDDAKASIYEEELRCG